MDSLYKKFRNTRGSANNLSRMGPERIVDALFCLYDAFNKGALLQTAPENIALLEDGTVSVAPEADRNIYYAAPEVVLGKSAADKNSGWFTMGLLAYFVINGRSYYEAEGLHIVNLQDMTKTGGSLIRAQGGAEYAEDIPGLLDLAMSRFTSWKPETRQEGVPFLLKAIQQYTATADIQYRYNGKIVSMESRPLTPPSITVAAGYRVTDSGGTVYLVRNSREIPFRPGNHKYAVDVEIEAAGRSAPSDHYEPGGAAGRPEKYLSIQAASRQGMSRLIRLDQNAQEKWVEVDSGTAARYLFFATTYDPVREKTTSLEYKFHVDIPAGAAGGRSLLRVSYNPPSECKIALYNQKGSSRTLVNAMHFEL